MAIRKIDRHKDYARYAAQCLEWTGTAKDQSTRSIQREMAAEWLRLADTVRLSSRRKQMQ